MQQLCFLSNLSSEQWAAWVQAVGSVVAIGVAIYVSRRQYLDARRLQQEQQRVERAQTLTSYRAILDFALGEYRQAHTALTATAPKAYFEDTSTHNLFSELHLALKEIPVLAMPTYESAKSLVRLRDLFKTAAWNVREALDSGEDNDHFTKCVGYLAHNIGEVEAQYKVLEVELRAVAAS